MACSDTRKIIDGLQANWIWVSNWLDSSPSNTAGRIVVFNRKFTLTSNATLGLLHFSADTRYKLYVNGKRVAVGPTRGSPMIWYYDSLDIAPFLVEGHNEVQFIVMRYFASSRGGMPFERTSFPGLTVLGNIVSKTEVVELASTNGWTAQVRDNILFPTGLNDDVFLHINERISITGQDAFNTLQAYNVRTLNGDLANWRLHQRPIPMPEENPVSVNTIRRCESSTALKNWQQYLDGVVPVKLEANSSHVLELQAEVHSTAFLKWAFKSAQRSNIKLKVTYSEGYELEPRSYPFFRKKEDRLESKNSYLIGPFDEIQLELPASQLITYEPFWFRTFRLIRLEISTGPQPVEFVTFEAAQTNYPLSVKADWREPGNPRSRDIWDVSIRTLRNCMFDGYSDCPFYEQLQYSCDSRSVGLFHYLLSGDDRLMRQSITNFAASVTPEGLTQSRFPSHTQQVIAGFSLYWILQVCDHYLYFSDRAYSRTFLPRIDGVLEFFDQHINDLGLISNLPDFVWQYVDWVTTWGATSEHPDKGVPTSGRKSNCHTYFSLLYAYVLKHAASLARDVGRPGHSEEYENRATLVLEAVRKHCYDGQFFTDSTADITDAEAYSQHCQVFAILSGAASPEDHPRLLNESFTNPRFSKCSYMMKFYALRAFAIAGDDLYEQHWTVAWDPWERMLDNNLTTWEEDDVRQRSDCHAWGSVPLYEYCTELAGIRPIAPGCAKLLFKPRLRLSPEIEAKVALGTENVASVSWRTIQGGVKEVRLNLQKKTEVVSQLPGCEKTEHGMVDHLILRYAA